MMTHFNLGTRGRRQSLNVGRGCALAAVVFVVSGSIARAQLIYVDGEVEGDPSPNISCAAGGPIGNCLVTNTAAVNDGLWGWIEAGAPTTGGIATTWESNTENAPELRMQVPAPNGTYDAYAVFWADVNVAFQIRAGLTSNPGANTLFGRTAAGGATAGTFGASAIWATPPGDNPQTTSDDDDNDATNILNPLTGDNPFVDHTPGGGGGLRLYLAPLGMVTASGGTGFNVFIDDLPSTNDQNRARFEGVAYVPAGTDVTLEATIDRATGNLTINNTTGAVRNIARYAISSPTGALDAVAWDNIAGGNASITEADAWTVSTNGAILNGNFLLAENESGGSNGAQLAATSGAFNLGNVWIKSIFEDVLVSLELVGGAKVQLLPTFTGDTYDPGDFDGDGDVDVTDYTALINNLHVPQTAGLTRVQYYKNGDMTGNNAVNRDDFIAFRNAYFAANPGSGAAEWQAMIASAGGVPEPASLALVTLAGGLLVAGLRRRRRIGRRCGGLTFRRPAALALSLVLGSVLSSAALAEDVTGWQVYNTSDPDATLGGANTNDPVFGNNTADAIDNAGIWGSLQSAISLNPSEEAVLHGRVQILGHSGANREFRWGMWKKVVQPTNPNTNATAGWLGYMALNGAGGGTGRLEAKNPDSDFQTALFISDQGGNLATASGPAPACGNPLLDGSCNGAANGRYFLLSEANVNGNAGFTNNATYTFEIRVGRYGANEATVSGSLVADAPAAPNGDFNNNGTVDAADYVLWRNGGPLQNEGGVTPGTTTAEDYGTWTANFGAATPAPYTFNIGGGLDINGQPPTNPAGGTYTDHVTFEFDRVGFLFGGALDADQATFQNITINKNTIQTLDLLVNPTSGATSIRNTLPTSMDIAYYEITSATNSLRRTGGWNSLDVQDGGSPPTNDIGMGWDEAAGSSDGILSEANLTESLILGQNQSVSLGNAFKTVANGGVAGTQDLRFFIGLADGSVLRGTVTYSAAGLASVVPEPGALGLLAAGGWCLTLAHRRRLHKA